MPRTRRGFGSIRVLPSKRVQAAYTGPDGRRYKAATTFGTRMDAEGWLSRRREEITDGVWTPGASTTRKVTTFADYAESWLSRRDLKPRTAEHYRKLLDRLILPTFGTAALRAITPTMVADWNHDLIKTTGPTYRAHAYSLLRTICRTAVDEDELTVSPCRVRGAGTAKRVKKIEPASLAQLEVIVAEMPDRGYPAGWRRGELGPREKGVDVELAVDLVTHGLDELYEVAIVMSQDHDLVPALDYLARRRISRGRPDLQVASWRGDYGRRPNRLNAPGHTLWCHWLTSMDYHGVRDETDYNVARPSPKRNGPPRPGDHLRKTR